MPTVTREYETTRGEMRRVRRKIPFRNLEPAEKKSYVSRLVASLGATGVALYFAIGNPGTAPSLEQERVDARQRVVETFNSMSDRQRFEAQYLSPAYVEPGSRDSVGGRGILGAWNDGPSFTLRVGQACLANTAFDTRGKDAYHASDVSAVAAVTYEQGLVVVHPAGNGSTSLEFASVGGILTPTPDTLGSLKANGCDIASGVPVASIDKTADYASAYSDLNFTPEQPLLP